MKIIIAILIVLILSTFLIAQQINYTWGYETDGTAYTQSGTTDTDSSSTLDVVFDMQDYYWLDWYPAIVTDTVDISADGDSVQAASVYSNSTRQYYGTIWVRVDAQNATDSVVFGIKAFAGNMIYHPNDDSRITTSNLNFSSTATVVADTGHLRQVNDVQWRPYNVYLNFTAGKFLPPEFIKLTFFHGVNCNDSLDYHWNFAYPAVYEYIQDQRRTTRSQGDARKREETLH